MIVHRSFQHGWFYHFRYHTHKTDLLCTQSLLPLKCYFESVKQYLPEEPFLSGPRSSQLKLDLKIKPEEITHHEVCALAKLGLELADYKTSHSNVECFMLHNDDKTVGVEVPIWVEAHEISANLPSYDGVFSSTDPLSGHIDIVRMENKKLWVWDYKPKAHLEKFASTQTFFYALMLSKRTGIPLDEFMCGYFDENKSFVFRPKIEMLRNLK
ncbi:MAG: PD-(D/E)XK nuclease family protein [Nanoarchaeota archaeon]